MPGTALASEELAPAEGEPRPRPALGSARWAAKPYLTAVSSLLRQTDVLSTGAQGPSDGLLDGYLK